MRSAAACLVVLLCLGSSACRREPPPATVLEPVVRVIDAVRPSRRAGIVHGEDVTLARDIRRTLVLPASAIGLMTLEGEGATARYRMAVMPDVARRWRHVRLMRKAEIHDETVDVAVVTANLADGAPVMPLAPLETPRAAIASQIHALLPAGAISVETELFAVSPGAVLRFDVGVHAPGARTDGAVRARVSVLDGDVRRPVWRRTLAGTDAAWHPEQVSLAAFAGRSVRLHFATHAADGGASGMLGVFGEPVVLAPRPRSSSPINVVLVSMDTLRARSVGAYGAERPTSPTLDALAADGVLFENAFSTAAFTLPGHMSMLTGLWFSSHGALTATSILSPAHRTLAESLRAAGYATAAFSSGAWIMPWTGFRRGFDVYHEQPPGLYGADTRGGTPYEAFTRGLDWLRDNADRPCFVFLHNYLVHTPYLPPEPYDRAFERLPPWAPEEERRRLAYEREVRYADDQLRALLEGLEALGSAGRTLVIVTSDHGEQFGEHGAVEHVYDVHDEVAHVPLVMRLPGAIPAGRRVAEPVSLADIAPTVLDVLGLPPMHGVDGTSLLPLIVGTTEHLGRDGVFTEAESEPKLGWVDLTAVRTGSHTCIHSARSGTHECYDRRVDPWERMPLSADDPSPGARAAMAAIARFRAARPAPGTGQPASGGDVVPASPADTPRARGVDAERRQQLRSLGYVD